MTDAADPLAPLKTEARAWFEALRGRIHATFEALARLYGELIAGRARAPLALTA